MNDDGSMPSFPNSNNTQSDLTNAKLFISYFKNTTFGFLFTYYLFFPN